MTRRVRGKTKRNAIRHAPSYIAGTIGVNADRPYTATTLETFLGIGRERIGQ